MDVKATMQKINTFLNTLPQIIKNSPRDEQIAYYTIFAGVFLLIVGIFVNILT